MTIEELKLKAPEELEEQVLKGLETQPLPFQELLDAVRALAAGPETDRANSCAELLADKLVELRDVPGLLRLFEAMTAWRNDDESFQRTAANALTQAAEARLDQLLVKNAGFGKNASLKQVLTRLRVLAGLKPGQYCQDKTWGFGLVNRVDDFYEKVVIDFTRKPGHAMTLAYAGEALQLVDGDHLLARKHKDPQGLQELVQKDPAEVVRIALRSFGPMNASALQERVAGHLIPEADWKKFWDSARKVLKEDPMIEIPAKRTDPIRLLDKPRDYGDEWFLAFRATSDPERLLQLLDELEERADVAALSEAAKFVVSERLAFVIRAAERKRPDLLAGAAMAGKRLGLAGVAGMDRVAGDLLSPAAFLKATADLPAREVGHLLRYLGEHDLARTAETMRSTLPDLTLAALTEVAEFLTAAGRQEELAGRLRSLLESQSAGVVVLCWAAKRLELVKTWRLATADTLLPQMVEALNEKQSGERLRAQNQLRAFFEEKEWLSQALAGTTALAREGILTRINEAGSWEISSRRLAMGAMIKLHPELAPVVASKPDEVASGRRGRYTSSRSYRERVQQRKQLMEVEIPQNSRDIAQARSYGDLRENAEYETARHQQRILMQRQGEIERDLTEVRPTDFAGFPTDRVGMGTCVTIRRADGRPQRYAILGEWDRDDALSIISCASRLAEILDGRRAGEEVHLPGAQSDELCTILEVTGLPEEIRTWARAE